MPPPIPTPLPVHVTDPALVARHAHHCADYFHGWATDLTQRLKASEGGGGIEPSRHLQHCARVADELRKACQRVERITRGGVDALNTSTLDTTKNVVEDTLRYLYRVADDDARKPTTCCVCDAPPLEGANVCSKHGALARQTMFYLLALLNEAMGYTEDATPGQRMRCDFAACERHAVVVLDDDDAGARHVRCAHHALPLVRRLVRRGVPPTEAAGSTPAHVDLDETHECAACSEPITTEPAERAESDWWHRACYAEYRAAKDQVVPLAPERGDLTLTLPEQPSADEAPPAPLA